MLPREDLEHVLQRTRCWDKLRGKGVFLTGASGFVGTWLRESFAVANAELSLEAELIAVPRDAQPAGVFDFGIHAAKAEEISADMKATRRALKFAEERRAERLLYTSSGAVYGKACAPGRGFREEDELKPETSYARAKCAGEQMCAASPVSTVVARMFTFSGPGLPLNANFAIGNFIRDALAGGPITVQGDGKSVRSYLYAADLAVWLWTILLDGEPGRAYNVGSPDPISIQHLAQTVRDCTRPGLTIRYLRQGSTDAYFPNTERARNELNLVPLIHLTEGIQRMYRYQPHLKSGELVSTSATTP